jgi:hypothetical protein
MSTVPKGQCSYCQCSCINTHNNQLEDKAKWWGEAQKATVNQQQQETQETNGLAISNLIVNIQPTMQEPTNPTASE